MDASLPVSEPMTERAAIYVRVSTARQAESDLSIPDQIAQCRAWCDRRGWQIVEVFSELGASALDEDRPVFQEMIYKATRSDHPFDYVVVHSLSRFSRDALHSELYVRQLRKASVELVSITQDVGQDGTGEFIRKMLNVFDEHQSREKCQTCPPRDAGERWGAVSLRLQRRHQGGAWFEGKEGSRPQRGGSSHRQRNLQSCSRRARMVQWGSRPSPAILMSAASRAEA
jgi:predicted site-specific integrase-resolvase